MQQQEKEEDFSCLECEHNYIPTNDGYKIAGSLFFPVQNCHPFELCFRSTVIIISGAMGVPSKFYRDYARYMCLKTKCVIATLDYRGGFRSKVSKNRVPETDAYFYFGKKENEIYADIQKKYITVMNWGRYDVPGMIDFIQNSPLDQLLNGQSFKWKGQDVKQVFPFNDFIHIGHSIGAQILAYFPQVYLQKLRGSFFVATQSGALKHWPLRQRAELYFYWYVFLPSLTFMYPREVPLFGVDNRIITDWYSAGRCHEKYLFEYYNIGDAKVNSQHVSWTLKDKPVTVYNVENDNFAPYDATMWLTRTFTEPTFVSDLKMDYFNEKSKTLQILDLNFDSSDRKLESFGGNQKRFYCIRGKIAKNIGHINFFREKEGKNECWPHLLAHCLDLLNDNSQSSPITRQSKL